jgi:hypothetical protein
MTEVWESEGSGGMTSARRLAAGTVPSSYLTVDVLCCPGTGVSGFDFSEEGISI